jgi:hypothetical protein
MNYVNQFLKLKCSGDVLNIVGPMNQAEKEISESMAIIKRIQGIALREPMQYTLYDLCAGNALTSVIAAYLLPFKQVIAVDKRERNRKWDTVKRFKYVVGDIKHIEMEEKAVIIGVHACGEASRMIIALYNLSEAEHLVLMPCCVGQIRMSLPQIIRETVGKYLIWCWDLAGGCIGKVNLTVDTNCLSPCNGIITASKSNN